MIERASTDADYAKSRGITREAAQSLLDAHKEAGEPKLPERVVPPDAPLTTSGKPWKKFDLLGTK